MIIESLKANVADMEVKVAHAIAELDKQLGYYREASGRVVDLE